MTDTAAPLVEREKIEHLLETGAGLKSISGLSDEQTETFYAYGYRFYEQNRFEEAALFFTSACLFDHKEQRYWMALGAVRQAAGEYDEALIAYARVAQCRQVNLLAALRAAECYLAIGWTAEAIHAIETAVDLVDNSSQPEEVVDEIVARGELLLQAAYSQIEEDEAGSVSAASLAEDPQEEPLHPHLLTAAAPGVPLDEISAATGRKKRTRV